jgi:hypothetical protein
MDRHALEGVHACKSVILDSFLEELVAYPLFPRRKEHDRLTSPAISAAMIHLRLFVHRTTEPLPSFEISRRMDCFVPQQEIRLQQSKRSAYVSTQSSFRE